MKWLDTLLKRNEIICEVVFFVHMTLLSKAMLFWGLGQRTNSLVRTGLTFAVTRMGKGSQEWYYHILVPRRGTITWYLLDSCSGSWGVNYFQVSWSWPMSKLILFHKVNWGWIWKQSSKNNPRESDKLKSRQERQREEIRGCGCSSGTVAGGRRQKLIRLRMNSEICLLVRFIILPTLHQDRRVLQTCEALLWTSSTVNMKLWAL